MELPIYVLSTVKPRDKEEVKREIEESKAEMNRLWEKYK